MTKRTTHKLLKAANLFLLGAMLWLGIEICTATPVDTDPIPSRPTVHDTDLQTKARPPLSAYAGIWGTGTAITYTEPEPIPIFDEDPPKPPRLDTLVYIDATSPIDGEISSRYASMFIRILGTNEKLMVMPGDNVSFASRDGRQLAVTVVGIEMECAHFEYFGEEVTIYMLEAERPVATGPNEWAESPFAPVATGPEPYVRSGDAPDWDSGKRPPRMLGINVEQIAPPPSTNLKWPTGATMLRISNVVDGSAAQIAGIRVGDVIVKFSGQYVTGGVIQMWDLLNETAPGLPAEIQIHRDGRALPFWVVWDK